MLQEPRFLTIPVQCEQPDRMNIPIFENNLASDSFASLGDVPRDEARASLNWLQKFVEHRFSGGTTGPVHGNWKSGGLLGASGSLPHEGRPLSETLSFFEAEIAPGLVRWNHPRFAAYFATSCPVPSIIAEALVAAHNSNMMLTSASPAASELDAVVGRWYQRLLNVPDTLTPQIFTSASQSHQHALAAAINRKTKGKARHQGITGQRPFGVYTSQLGHFFARKNAVAAGIGEESVRLIPVDDHGAMRVDVLENQIQLDESLGVQPLMVIATVGTTSITSVDPVSRIADVCRRHSIYSYVDAAYGGAFASLSEYQWITDGWELVDAVCINPHKALFVPQGCSLLFLRDRDELRKVCDHRAEYLPERNGAEGDPMDYTFLCGMRLATLASFFNLMTFGAEGIRCRLRHVRKLADIVAREVESEPIFELLSPPLFTTVCFTLRLNNVISDTQADAMVSLVSQALHDAGECLVSKTTYRNRAWLRMAIGNINTTEDDVSFILSRIRSAAIACGAGTSLA